MTNGTKALDYILHIAVYDLARFRHARKEDMGPWSEKLKSVGTAVVYVDYTT